MDTQAPIITQEAHEGPRPVRDTAHRGASMLDREVADWAAGQNHPDFDLLPELRTLAGRSIDLLRNHGISAGIIDTIVNSVVGHVMSLRATPDIRALGMTESYAEGLAEDMEAIWRLAAENPEWSADRSLDVLGQVRLAVATEIVEGEALALPLYLPERGGVINTKMQLIEPYRLQNPPYEQNSARLRNGIRLGPYGEPISYCIRKTNSTDQPWFMQQLYGTAVGIGDIEEIPAYTSWGRKRVLHLHGAERIGQTHGKPAMSPVLSAFRMLDHYERAELQGAVIQSRIAAIFESNLPEAVLVDLFGGNAHKMMSLRDEWQAKLQAGSIIQAFPGDKLNVFNPTRPGGGFTAFCDHISQRCGLPVGLPRELTLKDFSKTNYSSARAAIMEAWRSFLSRRRWAVMYFTQPCYMLVMEEAVNKRLIKAPTFYDMPFAWCSSRWTFAGRGWIDQVKEAQAAELRVNANMSTLDDECADQGKDWRETARQRAKELKYLKLLETQYGVTLISQPTVPKIATTAIDQNEGSQQQQGNDGGN
jgi:lambda family phage portal protein